MADNTGQWAPTSALPTSSIGHGSIGTSEWQEAKLLSTLQRTIRLTACPKRPPEAEPASKAKPMKSTRALRAQARAYGRHYYRGGLEVLTPLAILELKKSDLPTLYPAQKSYLRGLANGKAVIPDGFEELFAAVIDHAKRLLH